jgi:hypothetical protein
VRRQSTTSQRPQRTTRDQFYKTPFRMKKFQINYWSSNFGQTSTQKQQIHKHTYILVFLILVLRILILRIILFQIL